MTEKPNLEPNALVAKLLALKAEDAITYKGYIGPVKSEGCIILYTSLMDLSQSFEIKTSDILHSELAPGSVLPFGAVILWIKKDSEVICRSAVKKSDSHRQGYVQRRAGRLFMKVGNKSGCGDSGTGKCTSGCGDTPPTKCTSGCSDSGTGKCTSGCGDTPPTKCTSGGGN